MMVGRWSRILTVHHRYRLVKKFGILSLQCLDQCLTSCTEKARLSYLTKENELSSMHETPNTKVSSDGIPTSQRSSIAMGSDINLFGAVKVDPVNNRYPHCIVWTPIPCLTWLFPIIGHMGIATTSGVIRDFAGPYHVSEDEMAFGNPVKYWQLDVTKTRSGKDSWDRSVAEASEEYKHRMHNLCCDNCHSHVAMALNLMNYSGCSSWNMVKLCFLMLLYGKYISFCGFLKTWLPFLIIISVILLVAFLA